MSDLSISAGAMCDRIEGLIGDTTAGVALAHLQEGFRRVLGGIDPRDPDGEAHDWACLRPKITITFWETATGAASGAPTDNDDSTSTVTSAAAMFYPSMLGYKIAFTATENEYEISEYTSTTVVTVRGDASGEADADVITVTADGTYALPSDFDGMVGNFVYAYSASVSTGNMEEIGLEEMDALHRDSAETGLPEKWSIQPHLIAQVNTVTPATIEVDDVFTIGLVDRDGTGSSINFTCTSAANEAAGVKNVVEGLKASAVTAKAAGTVPWSVVACTEDDTKLFIIGDVAGAPFYVTTSTTDGGGADTQTLTDANTTLATILKYDVITWPPSDDDRTVRYRYKQRQQALTDSSTVYPPGPPSFHRAILMAGMAEAEISVADTPGRYGNILYPEAMRAAIDDDSSGYSARDVPVSMADVD